MENKSDKSDKKDYIVHLNKARKKRNKNDFERYIILAVIAVVVVVILLFAGKAIAKRVSAGAEKTTAATETESQAEDPGQLKIAAKEAEESEAEAQAKKTEEEKKAVVDSYQNLGIVLVSGYLNVRKEPNTSADIVGKLMGDSACEILDSTQEGWYKISSGGIEGYIDSQYVLTGDEAKTKAYELVTLRAIVQVDNLNIRKEANTTSDVVGQGLINERYEVIDQVDGWVQIPSGYMSADYVKLEYALNEARKLDLKAMIFNMYKNIGISDVDNYLNVREEPSEDGKVIAKMPSKAAGNILETTDNGWYKIQSGKITGYVKSDYILTGQAAKDEALKVAELMAIVNTDMLNARSEPSTDSKIWTQISNNEKYPVLKQIDGWVEIELEEDSNAYVASDYVDVRYALPEAIKFSPLEEKANAAASLRTQIVNYALQFLGNPYVWGGTSLTKGADCSGFTMQVYAHFGISTGRSSRDQAAKGREISVSAVQPGDLLFYASGNYINHVAMYIGGGQVIHASTPTTGITLAPSNYRTPCKAVTFLD